MRILLFIVSEHTAPENAFVQRAGIYLLNSLACHVNTEQKLLVGNLGAMEKMLGIIRDRVNAGTYDDVLETAWSCMWNVTDETPINCKRFLDGGGMQLFLNCKERFPESQDLLRNMMGLLGNVAEVPHLRSQLMTREFVAVFSLLLNSNSDGIEVRRFKFALRFSTARVGSFSLSGQLQRRRGVGAHGERRGRGLDHRRAQSGRGPLADGRGHREVDDRHEQKHQLQEFRAHSATHQGGAHAAVPALGGVGPRQPDSGRQ